MFELMTIKDFAKDLGKSEFTVRTWIRQGDLPADLLKRIGGTVFIRANKFKEWVDKEE